MPLRLIFMGTPEFAVPTLAEIVGRGHEVVAVYTRAAKPAGRGMAPTPTPVEREARRFGLAVHTPATLRTLEAAAAFRAQRAEAAVVVAYGLILPKPILGAVPLGCFNLHASLLPRWRGAAPINRALMARALAALERSSLTLTSQPAEGVTYAAKIGNDETRIVWTRPAQAVHDHIRGLSPFPGAWFELSDNGKPVRVKVLRTTKAAGSGSPGTLLDDALTVACAEGAVRILELQRAGRQAMGAADFLRGQPLARGTTLP